MAIGLFGVQGGYWGTGIDMEKQRSRMLDQLMTPEEFENIPKETRGFTDYMSYLNTFARRQRGKKIPEAAYRAALEGTFDPSEYGFAGGNAETRSSTSKIPTGKGGGAGGLRTTKITDIRGIPRTTIAGQGVKRDIRGRVIPQTTEQFEAQSELDIDKMLAIPRTREKLEAEQFALEQARPTREIERGKKKMEGEDLAYRSGMTAEQRYGASKEAQAAARIAIKQEEVSNRARQITEGKTHKEAMEAIKQANRKELLNLSYELRGASAEENRNWKEHMAEIKGEIVGTQPFSDKMRVALERSLVMVEAREEVAKKAEERAALRRERETLEKSLEWWRQARIRDQFGEDREATIQAETGRLEGQIGEADRIKKLNEMGARRAKDGNWYVKRDGKWMKVDL